MVAHARVILSRNDAAPWIVWSVDRTTGAAGVDLYAEAAIHAHGTKTKTQSPALESLPCAASQGRPHRLRRAPRSHQSPGGSSRDGLVPSDPAVYARLPKVHRDESRTEGLDRLELIRFLQIAQTVSVHHGALAYLLENQPAYARQGSTLGGRRRARPQPSRRGRLPISHWCARPPSGRSTTP